MENIEVLVATYNSYKRKSFAARKLNLDSVEALEIAIVKAGYIITEGQAAKTIAKPAPVEEPMEEVGLTTIYLSKRDLRAKLNDYSGKTVTVVFKKFQTFAAQQSNMQALWKLITDTQENAVEELLNYVQNTPTTEVTMRKLKEIAYPNTTLTKPNVANIVYYRDAVTITGKCIKHFTPYHMHIDTNGYVNGTIDIEHQNNYPGIYFIQDIQSLTVGSTCFKLQKMSH